jgi:hypothetical protein
MIVNSLMPWSRTMQHAVTFLCLVTSCHRGEAVEDQGQANTPANYIEDQKYSPTGYSFTADGQTRWYTPINNEAVVEGDIVIGSTQALAQYRNNPASGAARQFYTTAIKPLVDGRATRWPNGRIPYQINPHIPNEIESSPGSAGVAVEV